nr:gamma-glutamyl hydrolase-like [Nomia melanderi]
MRLNFSFPSCSNFVRCSIDGCLSGPEAVVKSLGISGSLLDRFCVGNRASKPSAMVATRSTAILILASFLVVVSGKKAGSNDRPIIGVLSQEVTEYVNGRYENQYNSYIAASYVKFVEGAGARVVPIWINKSNDYYEDIMRKINGVLWPGGASTFNKKHGYADAGKKIYKIAKRFNDNGNHFPILGVCLGFELLTYLTADGRDDRDNCNAERISLPLKFEDGYRDSNMYRAITDDLVTILETKNVTANFHHFCVTKAGLKRVGIANKLKVLSTSRANGTTFVSSVESTEYPFFGVQFHPEKNLYEWIEGRGIPHDKKAVLVAQYFANFFVNEARKNRQRFEDSDEEVRSLIYNYPVTYTAQKNILFQQCYLFKANTTL